MDGNRRNKVLQHEGIKGRFAISAGTKEPCFRYTQKSPRMNSRMLCWSEATVLPNVPTDAWQAAEHAASLPPSHEANRRRQHENQAERTLYQWMLLSASAGCVRGLHMGMTSSMSSSSSTMSAPMMCLQIRTRW